MNIFRLILLILVICSSLNGNCQSLVQHSIIPIPSSVKSAPGQLRLSEIQQIIIPTKNPELKKLAELMKKELRLSAKITESRSPKFGNTKSIVLNTPYTERHPDMYTLNVSKTGILIFAQESKGLFYGFQTLKQLAELTNFETVGFYVIEDQSTFSYRGMHLDVSRHFFSVEFVKQYIDLLARYKFNKFHWHLTDDQGWRIEIKKYPLLTEIGSIRKKTLIGAYGSNPVQYDEKEYSGFYTQEEIKEVVQYAKERYIDIIPEIEMPGHSMAALAAYPHLGCHAGPYEVATTWGVSNNTLCPTDTTLQFMKDVLDEVCELFPSQLIHIGGDEVMKDVWKKSDECAKIMRRQKIKTYDELQSYFIKQIDIHLTKRGKTLVGWDEILEGGLSQNAVVMSWRGTEGGIQAAKLKHDVIMCPGTHCYFDHYQSVSSNEPLAIGGYTSLEKVYSFNPIPEELKAEQQKYILGSQGNVWTEYILNNEHVLYMAFPRAIALAEVNWSTQGSRNYKNFLLRMNHHYNLFKKNNINLSTAYLDLNYRTNIYDDKLFLIFNKPPIDGKILIENETLEDGLQQEYLKKDSIELTESREYKSWFQLPDNTLGRSINIKFSRSKSTACEIRLNKAASSKYSLGGSTALINGIDAPSNKFSGQEWSGFESGSDLEAFIDLRKMDSIGRLSVQVFQEESSWIYLPKSIELFSSENGNEYNLVKKFDIGLRPGRSINLIIDLDKTYKSRYWKVLVKNYGTIDNGRPGKGKGAWLFIGEVRLD
ncbi:MAG: family 20 glycosylhydrolase [Saprospiraceae bacterium]|nr:family 20 glycosylhydrolase [Saprospiraceae bacterium]